METFDPSSASFLNILHLRIHFLIPYEDGPDKNMLGQSRIPKIEPKLTKRKFFYEELTF